MTNKTLLPKRHVYTFDSGGKDSRISVLTGLTGLPTRLNFSHPPHVSADILSSLPLDLPASR